MASLLCSHLCISPSPPALAYSEGPRRIPSLLDFKCSARKSMRYRSLMVSFALAESDSPKSIGDETLPLFQELADSFRLPPDYFTQLPRDLRLDLNDAAFDLANGPVVEECGQELGEMLLNLSQAWEQADTSTSTSIVTKLPSLQGSLSDNAKSAFGKRLLSAGRRFEAMGQYGQGELQRIANNMVKTGKVLSARPAITTTEKPKMEARTLKFGELQVELTPAKANIGAAIGIVFGILSWQLSQGIENLPESSLQYAKDNALVVAKSLRGALLAICYSSTVLSAFATVGLILLGRQLNSESKSKQL